MKTQINRIVGAVFCPHEGRLADRQQRWTEDAVDAERATTNAPDADGEVVRS